MKNNGNAEMESSCCNAHLLYKTWTAKNWLKWKAVVVPLKRSVQGKGFMLGTDCALEIN